jgi:2,5-diketo-D-gluconate reductase B
MSVPPATCPVVDGMPMLGLGTWQNDDPRQCAESVRTALESGYRHVDTAQAYGNEAAVGDGIAAADVPREEVFLATKVWIDSLGYDKVLETTAASLDRVDAQTVEPRPSGRRRGRLAVRPLAGPDVRPRGDAFSLR